MGMEELESMSLANLPISRILHASATDLDRHLAQLEMFGDKGKFVVLPAYHEHRRITDFQLAVTGKSKKGETPSQTIHREIAEEIGLETSPDIDISTLQKVDWKGHPYTLTVAIHYAGDSAPGPSQRADFMTGEDDSSKKCLVWYIIDQETDVLQRHRVPTKTSGDQGGEVVVVMKVSDVVMLIRRLFNKP
jgi:8-oxo-dGTP pyrophosphatase MutT (NUDIX family)